MFRKIEVKATCMLMAAQDKIKEFMHKEDGDVNIVSIVVLIGIAVLLAIVFRKAIGNLLNNMFNTIGTNANKAITE